VSINVLALVEKEEKKEKAGIQTANNFTVTGSSEEKKAEAKR